MEWLGGEGLEVLKSEVQGVKGKGLGVLNVRVQVLGGKGLEAPKSEMQGSGGKGLGCKALACRV